MDRITRIATPVAKVIKPIKKRPEAIADKTRAISKTVIVIVDSFW
jgi:hypothetical protein